ncbi:MAG: HPP family protein [Anaerolineae bacterium]|nr:HPP family protein [Gloeobacterales cyanobacterium ES-bin-313]
MKNMWASRRNRFTALGKLLGGTGAHKDVQPQFSNQQILLSWAGAIVGIGALAYLSLGTGYPLVIAPFGATSVLVFGVPDSPLAQPRNVLLGNCLSACIAVALVALFGAQPLVMALAVATAIAAMQWTRSVHPPAGAVALVGVMSHASWPFILAPVFCGSLVLVCCTFAFSTFAPGRTYPRHWF